MSTQKKNALICDDDEDRIKIWKKHVENGLGRDDWSVSTMSSRDLAEAVNALTHLEQNSKENLQAPLTDSQTIQIENFNSASLVILDSDLTPHAQDIARWGEQGKDISHTLRNRTGDVMARLIRTHTGAGYIVVVNRFSRSRYFDLTMMQAAAMHADLHISGSELEVAALWTGNADNDPYNPWHWPILRQAQEVVMAVEPRIDLPAKVLDTLGLHQDQFAARQLDIFGKVKPAEATFQDLADSSLGFGLPNPGRSDEEIRRMAASVIRRWLEKTVVAAQNVVTDLPHLITRFPVVLGEGSENVMTLAWSTNKSNRPDESRLDLIAEAKSQVVSDFIGRPVYGVEAIRRLLPNLPKADPDLHNLVFAEDTSDFVLEETAQQFTTDLPGTYTHRYIREVPGVSYEPVVRRL